MYLERDAFRIAYECDEVDVERIMEKIRRLGYAPREIEPQVSRTEPRATPTRQLPEPVRSAAADHGTVGKPLFLDFYADWCGPCKVLEKRVLAAPEVVDALQEFRVVKVDTDRYARAAKYFDIVGLPTLIVLDESGVERFRHVGPITTEALIGLLRDSQDVQR